MKKLLFAFLFCAFCASGVSAKVLDEPVLLVTAKSGTEFFLDEYDYNESNSRMTVVINGHYSDAEKLKTIEWLTKKKGVPFVKARKLSNNVFCFRFDENGDKFQRVYDRYFDEDGELVADVPVNKKKWEPVKPQLTSGKAYSVALEFLEAGTEPDPDAPPENPAVGDSNKGTAGDDQPLDWAKSSYVAVAAAIKKGADVNAFIPYTDSEGNELEGYAVAVVANRTDKDAGRILGLMLDSGADLENEPQALANYIRAQGSKLDMAVVNRMARSKAQLNPALLACSVKPYPGDALARKLIEAGASVNDIADQNSSMLLEALNAKADPRLIKLLVANGADIELEGEIWDGDMENGETVRGTPLDIAKRRGYGQDILDLLAGR